MKTLLTPDDVARCCTAGLLLELATTPKPGLVDRSSPSEQYAQFLASATALYKHFHDAAAGRSVGDVVLNACLDMLSWQRGGNTHLGAVLLLTPVAKAAGSCRDFNNLRRRVEEVLKKINQAETLKIFKAVRTVNPGHLGRVAYLDVFDEKTYRRIAERRIGVQEAFKPYGSMEVVAAEYTTSYRASFIHGYKHLRKQLTQLDLNTAGVNTFLNIMSHLPDSHVSRMFGRHAARTLSRMARRVLDHGGFHTDRGRRTFEDMAGRVLRAGFKPAATADVLAVSYTLLLLSGWRP
ncbi:MAG: triphosphoribosyl-dephospho-CoA synthase [Candidatus Caldarchaeum sp.]